VADLELLTLNLETMSEKSTEHQDSTNQPLLIADVRQRIIDYTNWLMKQNLMICEGVDGYSFRSSMIGGKKYSAEELYDKFVSEYVA
jgi:tRNA A-37 threonylcarbamoyl transferase component Bud32